MAYVVVQVYDSIVGRYKEVKKKFGRGLSPPLVKVCIIVIAH
jgi:hypothetical protein